MKYLKILGVSLVFSLPGCSVMESLTCQIGGWEPDEIEECDPSWVPVD